MATYMYPQLFEKVFQNYLMEEEVTDTAAMDPNQHLITIDLAVYDEVQWQKVMHDQDMKTSMQKAIDSGVGHHDSYKPMSCHERLSHAIQIDKIKLFPNSSMIIEKVQKRNIVESHDERIGSKEKSNKYHELYDSQALHTYLDNEHTHAHFMDKEDQTWYFAIADCNGKLEVFHDDKKNDHMLGLREMWEDINERQDFKDMESMDEELKEKNRRDFDNTRYSGEATLQETQLLNEIKEHDEFDHRMEMREEQKLMENLDDENWDEILRE